MTVEHACPDFPDCGGGEWCHSCAWLDQVGDGEAIDFACDDMFGPEFPPRPDHAWYGDEETQ